MLLEMQLNSQFQVVDSGKFFMMSKGGVLYCGGAAGVGLPLEVTVTPPKAPQERCGGGLAALGGWGGRIWNRVLKTVCKQVPSPKLFQMRLSLSVQTDPQPMFEKNIHLGRDPSPHL